MRDINEWKEFKLSDYFDISAGHYYYPDEYDEGDTPYISASNANNGVAQYIDLPPDFEGNCIVTGKVGCTAFYQADPFCATSDVNVFKPKFEMSSLVGLFVTSIINFNENYKWAYGRQCRVGNSKKIIVKLPATEEGEPDWNYMERFMGGLHSQPLTTSKKSSQMQLETSGWKEYRLEELFEIKKGKRLTAEDQIEGDTPYIGAIDSNNGVANLIGQAPIHKGNTISLSYNGSVGEAFYQSEDFWATDDVNVLYFRESNKTKFNMYIALFICAVLRQEQYRFSYGRKWTLENMKKSIIKLPATDDGAPNWGWMESYIKSLPMAEHLPQEEMNTQYTEIMIKDFQSEVGLKVAEKKDI